MSGLDRYELVVYNDVYDLDTALPLLVIALPLIMLARRGLRCVRARASRRALKHAARPSLGGAGGRGAASEGMWPRADTHGLSQIVVSKAE